MDPKGRSRSKYAICFLPASQTPPAAIHKLRGTGGAVDRSLPQTLPLNLTSESPSVIDIPYCQIIDRSVDAKRTSGLTSHITLPQFVLGRAHRLGF